MDMCPFLKFRKAVEEVSFSRTLSQRSQTLGVLVCSRQMLALESTWYLPCLSPLGAPALHFQIIYFLQLAGEDNLDCLK